MFLRPLHVYELIMITPTRQHKRHMRQELSMLMHSHAHAKHNRHCSLASPSQLLKPRRCLSPVDTQAPLGVVCIPWAAQQDVQQECSGVYKRVYKEYMMYSSVQWGVPEGTQRGIHDVQQSVQWGVPKGTQRGIHDVQQCVQWGVHLESTYKF